jgi:hypothetical protein
MAATTISNRQVESAIKRLDNASYTPVSERADGYLRAARSAYENGRRVTAMEQVWKAGRMLAIHTLVRRDYIDETPNDAVPRAKRLSELETNRKRILQVGQITEWMLNKESVDWNSFNIPVLTESDLKRK